LNGDSAGQTHPDANLDAHPAQFGRGLRSGAFVALFACYSLVFIGLGQRLIVWPMVTLFPRRRTSVVRVWLRMQAYATLAMARMVAGVRLTVRGTIPPQSCIVVMNHQSVLDIPLGVWLIRGPQVVIPTRDRYRRGVPGISPLVRLAGFPIVSQKRTITREELQGLTDAADLVARGERTLLIFPEGHRTRDGAIGRFMRSGLRIMLARTSGPVYCVVADGMTSARTTTDALTGFGSAEVRVTILGPFTLEGPATPEAVDAFMESLRQRMVDTLTAMRAEAAPATIDAAAPATTR
jgi:1-acyl-sn-glycerol-3-phosphate acyltransferase